MAIKHLGWYTSPELKEKDTLPFWKKREMLISPFIIPIGIGYAIFYVLYALYFIIKWILFAWISPFIYSPIFCKIGFHKYRALDEERYRCLLCQNKIGVHKYRALDEKRYRCLLCQKEYTIWKLYI